MLYLPVELCRAVGLIGRSFRQLTARILTEQQMVQICMRLGMIRTVRAEMNGLIDCSAGNCPSNIPYSFKFTSASDDSRDQIRNGNGSFRESVFWVYCQPTQLLPTAIICLAQLCWALDPTYSTTVPLYSRPLLIILTKIWPNVDFPSHKCNIIGVYLFYFSY